MARKFVGDPAPAGKGSGLKTVGETKATKAALAKCGGDKYADKYGRKK